MQARIAHGGALGVLLTVGAACGGVDGPPTTIVEADSADRIVFGLEHNVTLDGVLQARVEADTAFFYDASQTAELKQLTVVFYTAQGQESSTLTAAEGTYRWRTGDMVARRDVVGLTPDGKRLTTPMLQYDRLAHKLSSSEPFVFDAPDRHLEGTGFTADPDFTDVRATGISGRAHNR